MGLCFLWFYVQELPKVQPAVVLVLKRLRRQGNGLKSHPTDWEKPGIEPDDLSKNMAARGGASFSYLYIWKTLKTSCQKLMGRFKNNCTNGPWVTLFQECSNFIDPSKKIWPPGGDGDRFSYVYKML